MILHIFLGLRKSWERFLTSGIISVQPSYGPTSNNLQFTDNIQWYNCPTHAWHIDLVYSLKGIDSYYHKNSWDQIYPRTVTCLSCWWIRLGNQHIMVYVGLTGYFTSFIYLQYFLIKLELQFHFDLL